MSEMEKKRGGGGWFSFGSTDFLQTHPANEKRIKVGGMTAPSDFELTVSAFLLSRLFRNGFPRQYQSERDRTVHWKVDGVFRTSSESSKTPWAEVFGLSNNATVWYLILSDRNLLPIVEFTTVTFYHQNPQSPLTASPSSSSTHLEAMVSTGGLASMEKLSDACHDWLEKTDSDRLHLGFQSRLTSTSHPPTLH